MTDEEIVQFAWPDCPADKRDKFLASISPKRRRAFEIMFGVEVMANAGVPHEDILDFMRSECGRP